MFRKLTKYVLIYGLAAVILTALLSSPIFAQSTPMRRPNLPQLREQFRKNVGQGTQEEQFSRRQEFMLGIVEKMRERFQQALEKIDSDTKVPEERSAEVRVDLESRLTTIQSFEGRIQNATTLEELLKIGKEMRLALSSQKGALRGAGKVQFQARTEKLIERTRSMQERFEKIITIFSQKGIMDAELENLVAEYNNLIENAVSRMEESTSLIQAGDTKGGIESAKEARVFLQDSFAKSREIFSLIKAKIQQLKDGVESSNI
jgi:hypothetical protein